MYSMKLFHKNTNYESLPTVLRHPSNLPSLPSNFTHCLFVLAVFEYKYTHLQVQVCVLV